jgi:hypothetical protein
MRPLAHHYTSCCYYTTYYILFLFQKLRDMYSWLFGPHGTARHGPARLDPARLARLIINAGPGWPTCLGLGLGTARRPIIHAGTARYSIRVMRAGPAREPM